MRMWPVPASTLCQKHLLGEHVEMHMFAGSLDKGTGMTGYIEGGQVSLANLTKRHNLLSAEMSRRGYSHSSPLVNFRPPKPEDVERSAEVFMAKSLESAKDLWSRCPECARRMREIHPDLMDRCLK